MSRFDASISAATWHIFGGFRRFGPAKEINSCEGLEFFAKLQFHLLDISYSTRHIPELAAVEGEVQHLYT